jgi:hypothetical protein
MKSPALAGRPGSSNIIRTAPFTPRPEARQGFSLTNAKLLHNGLIIRCAMLFGKDGRHWVNFPAKEWVKPDGTRGFYPLLEFASREVRERFQSQVFAARRKGASGNGPMNALQIALGLGLPVFPCLPCKRPATPHGFKDATSDPDCICRFDWHDRLIGVPTGQVSGLAVLDVDKKMAAANGTMQTNIDCPQPASIARAREGFISCSARTQR